MKTRKQLERENELWRSMSVYQSKAFRVFFHNVSKSGTGLFRSIPKEALWSEYIEYISQVIPRINWLDKELQKLKEA